jgi:ABC-type dipeptide/oligopeptide/nickel transport system permease component
VPGDPVAMLMPAGATAADVENMRHQLGLDRSIPVQFVSWIGDVAHGDFGASISMHEGVLGLVARALPASLELVGLAFVLATAAGTMAALAGAFWAGRWPEALIDGAAGLIQAVPDFIWGLLFVLVFGVLLPILPITGRLDPRLPVSFVTPFFLLESLVRGNFGVLVDLLRHMILPAAALALPFAAIVTRLLKSSLADAMAQDYAFIARVRGFSRWQVLVGEALRNALIPVVTLSGVQLTFLLGGAVLVERVFGYPGIGNLALDAILSRDLPLIQMVIFTFALLFAAINLAVDLACFAVDPRLRHG